MIVLTDDELCELIQNKHFSFKVEVQGYDVFEYITDGFYKGNYRVHGKSLYDVPELDEDDNIINVVPKGTFQKSIVVPKHIDKCCPFTNGDPYVYVYDVNGCQKIIVLNSVKIIKDNDKYYWDIKLFL